LSVEDFTKFSSANGLCSASAGSVPLNASIGLAEALDVVRGVLGVAPIEAAAFVAKFYGRMAHNQSHVVVFVKACMHPFLPSTTSVSSTHRSD